MINNKYYIIKIEWRPENEPLHEHRFGYFHKWFNRSGSNFPISTGFLEEAAIYKTKDKADAIKERLERHTEACIFTVCEVAVTRQIIETKDIRACNDERTEKTVS